MKQIIILLFIFSLNSCNSEKKITMINYQLKNGDSIELEYFVGTELGATIPDVTWIRKILKKEIVI